MNRQKLIRELARAADVSRAEAADAVDELTHRLLLAMRRLDPPTASAAGKDATRGREPGSRARGKISKGAPKENSR